MVESALLQDSAVRRAAVTAVDGALVASSVATGSIPKKCCARSLGRCRRRRCRHVCTYWICSRRRATARRLPVADRTRTRTRGHVQRSPALRHGVGRRRGSLRRPRAPCRRRRRVLRSRRAFARCRRGRRTPGAVARPGRRAACRARGAHARRAGPHDRHRGRLRPFRTRPDRHGAGADRSGTAPVGCSIAPNPTVPTTSCRSSSGSANPSTRARSPRPSATWWIGTKRCGRTTRTRRVRRSRAAGTSRSRSSTSPCPATSSTDGSDGWHPGRST